MADILDKIIEKKLTLDNLPESVRKYSDLYEEFKHKVFVGDVLLSIFVKTMNTSKKIEKKREEIKKISQSNSLSLYFRKNSLQKHRDELEILKEYLQDLNDYSQNILNYIKNKD